MPTWVIVLLAVVAAASTGCCAGYALAVFYGGRMAHTYADLLSRNCPVCNADDDPDEPDD